MQSRLGELGRLYGEHTKAKTRDETQRLYSGIVGRFIDRYGADRDAGSITARDVSAYRDERLSSGISRGTVNRDAHVLRQWFRWAVANGYLGSNPTDGLDSIKVRREHRRRVRRELSSAEIERLLAVSDPDERFAWLLLLHTGARRREAVSLLATDYCHATKTITFRSTVSKNGDEERIPVSSALAEAYALRLANGNLGYHLCPFRYDGLMDRFRSCCEKAGIAGVDLHCLRKTFICRHARADGNPKITQAFARHRDISITLGIYAEVNGLDLAGKADVA